MYYANFPSEQIEQVLESFPLMETMLVAQIAEYSEGELSLSKLELVSSEMGSTSATFMIEAIIGGDFQKGIQAAVTNMGLVYTEEGYDVEELSVIELESFSSSLVYVKESLTFEMDSRVTVVGDIDEQVNVLKEHYLTEIIQQEYLDDKDLEMINEFLLPTILSVKDLHFDSGYKATDGTIITSFTLTDLGIAPPSFEAFTDFLHYMSEESPLEDFMLVIEGGSIGSESVVISSPEGSNPVSEDSNRVVWEFDNAKNLDQVSLDIASPSPLGNTTMIIAVVGLIVVGAAAFFFLRKK
jgi:hypothetical protein